MDKREIAGILLIAVVAATIVTYFMQGASERPLEILEEKVPDAVPPGEKTNHEFSLSLVLRSDVEALIWDIDCLTNATGEPPDDPTSGIEDTTQIIRDFCDSIGAPYVTEDIQVGSGEGTLYDFSHAFSRFAPERAVITCTTVYALLDIDGQETAFRGVTDYFSNRNFSLASITLSKNEMPETYLTMQAGEAAAQGKPSVMEAPLLGAKEYGDSREDDRLSLRLVIDSIGVPAHEGVLEVSRIWVDGETEVAQGYLIPAQ
jgi:hypothetical protein